MNYSNTTSLLPGLIDKIIDLEQLSDPAVDLEQLTETLDKLDYYTLQARLIKLNESTVTESHETPLEAPLAAQSVDRDAMAKIQLETLGYVKTEKVFLRFFYPKWHPKYKDDKGSKSEFNFPAIPWASIDRLQSDGRGCYFVVNGQGQKDENVSKGKAIFYEHDDLPRELQLDLWTTLGLPVPTIQIDTGGKSIHSYWVFDEPIDIAQWKTLQTDLLDFSDGDRSIKNESRVMRLAGALHIGEGGNNQSVIVSNSGTRYSFDDLRSIVPKHNTVTDVSTKSKAPKPLRLATETVSMAVESSNSSTPSLLEIEKALLHVSPDCGYGDWLHIGMALHSQDTNLLSEWDSWSSGSKNKPSEKYKGECAKKWKTFTPDDGINIYKLFQIAKAQNTGYQAPKAIESQIQQIKEAANSVKSFNPKYQDEVEDFTADSFEDTRIAINKRREINQQQGVLKSVLEGTELGSIVSKLSDGSSIPFEALLTMIIPMYAPLIAGNGRVKVGKKTAWYEPFIFYVAMCAESSQAKTPITSPLLKPLYDFEQKLADDYKVAKQQYDSEFEQYQTCKKEQKNYDGLAPEQPKRRRYIMSEFTFESFKSRVVTQPGKGIAVFIDELKGMFESLDQYRKGSDFQNLLSWWSGGAVNRDTKSGGDEFCRNTGNSFSGTIQPGVLRDLRKTVDSDDSAGFWYRWLTYTLPSNWQYDLEEDENSTFDFGEECDRALGNLIRVWDSWGEFEIKCDIGTGKWIDDRIKSSIISPEYRGKLKAYAIRFAGFVACVEGTKEFNSCPPTKLDHKYLRMGLDMVKFYFLQNEVAFSNEGSGDEVLEKIHCFVLKKGSATVGVIKNRVRILAKTPAGKITDLCEKCSIAYPDLVWDGKILKIK